MDCNHICCDIRENCNHSHTVDPNDCMLCERAKNGESLPQILTTEMAHEEEDR